MKRNIWLLLVSVYTTCAFGQTVNQKLDDYFRAATTADIFNGSVLIAQKGQVLLNKGYGYKNLEAKTMADTNTIYQIGSVTKQFTSTIILKLAEQKKLALTDKLSKYFPAFPNAEKITIENLLSHTSGIWNYTNDPVFMQTRVERPLSRDSMLLLIKDKPLDFEPGTKYSYSNSGYMLLGYIIEKVSGKKYENVVRQTIFQPLGMTHSGFDFIHLHSPDKATGYGSIVAGAGKKSMIVDSSVSFSAGALYTTVGDLYKWNQSLNTEKILKKSSLDNAFTPRLNRYALGFSVDTVFGHRVLTHGGGIHGFLSSNTWVPADEISITFISNANSSKMEKINRDVLAIVYDQPYQVPEVKKEITLDATLLQQYTGEYQLAPGFSIVVTLSGNSLKAQATGQQQFDVFAMEKDKFFLKVVDAQIDFKRNDKGEVESLVLHQAGRDMPGKKIK